MTNSFTPGPWTIHWNMGGGDFHWIVPTNDQSMRIAMVETYAPTDGDMEAMGKINAKLIAAAPTMFSFIEKMAAGGDTEAIALMGAINGTA